LLQAVTDAKLTVRNALAEIMADEFNLIGEGLLEVGGAIGASVAVGVADAVAPAVSRAVGQAAGQAVGGLAQRLPQVAAARGAVGGGVRSALAKVPTSSMGRNLAFALVQFFLIKDRAGQTGDKAMNFITQWDEAINQVAANERETIDDYAEYYTGIVKAAYGVCKGNGEGCYMRMGHMPELSFTARTYSAESILTCAGGEERARIVLDDDRSWKQRVAEAMRKREGK
jgi:hypothetical protein